MQLVDLTNSSMCHSLEPIPEPPRSILLLVLAVGIKVVSSSIIFIVIIESNLSDVIWQKNRGKRLTRSCLTRSHCHLPPMSETTSFSEIIWFPLRVISFWVVLPPAECLVIIFSFPSLSRMTIFSSNSPPWIMEGEWMNIDNMKKKTSLAYSH